MKIAKVVFTQRTSRGDYISAPKIYEYRTDLELIPHAVYRITADNVHIYNNCIEFLTYSNTSTYPKSELREITKADIVKAPGRKPSGIHEVIFNEEKRVTVVLWQDGTKTKVSCAQGDAFDKEKAIMACYMKKLFDNRGYYNEYLKEWTEDK